jgi:hypothetical protein
MSDKPIACHPHKRRDTRQLWFPSGKQAEFYVRGAVAWPVAADRGFAVVAGVECESGVCHIFQQHPFSTIPHVTHPDTQRIVSRGFGPWAGEMATAYGIERWHERHPDDTHRLWLLQLLRWQPKAPKPVFVHVAWDSIEDALATMWQWFNAGLIVIDKSSPIEGAMQRLHGSPGAVVDPDPVLRALLTLLTGLTLYPWRRRTIERDIFAA